MASCLTITQPCPDNGSVPTLTHANPLRENTFQITAALLSIYNHTSKTHEWPPRKHTHVSEWWGIPQFTYSVTPIVFQKGTETSLIQILELTLLSTHCKYRLGNKRTYICHIYDILCITVQDTQFNRSLWSYSTEKQATSSCLTSTRGTCRQLSERSCCRIIHSDSTASRFWF